ncbi:MAG: LamG domain-containing protein [Verrucomicrobiaceae bacterium]
MKPRYSILLAVFFSQSSHAATTNYWRFEEGTAGNAATGSSTVIDSVGGNHGTPAGSPSYIGAVPVSAIPATGAPNTVGLGFNGSSAVVTAPSPAFMNGAGAAFTVEFWMRSAAPVGGGQELLVDKSHGFGDNTGWFFQTGAGNGVLAFGIGNGSSFPGVASVTDLYDNSWHHVAGTYDGNEIELFVDGTSQGTLVAGTSAANTRELEFGRARNGGRFFGGDLDEIRISDTVLSPSEFLSVPEPSTSLLTVLFGLVTLGVRRR